MHLRLKFKKIIALAIVIVFLSQNVCLSMNLEKHKLAVRSTFTADWQAPVDNVPDGGGGEAAADLEKYVCSPERTSHHLDLNIDIGDRKQSIATFKYIPAARMFDTDPYSNQLESEIRELRTYLAQTREDLMNTIDAGCLPLWVHPRILGYTNDTIGAGYLRKLREAKAIILKILEHINKRMRADSELLKGVSYLDLRAGDKLAHLTPQHSHILEINIVALLSLVFEHGFDLEEDIFTLLDYDILPHEDLHAKQHDKHLSREDAHEYEERTVILTVLREMVRTQLQTKRGIIDKVQKMYEAIEAGRGIDGRGEVQEFSEILGYVKGKMQACTGADIAALVRRIVDNNNELKKRIRNFVSRRFSKTRQTRIRLKVAGRAVHEVSLYNEDDRKFLPWQIKELQQFLSGPLAGFVRAHNLNSITRQKRCTRTPYAKGRMQILGKTKVHGHTGQPISAEFSGNLIIPDRNYRENYLSAGERKRSRFLIWAHELAHLVFPPGKHFSYFGDNPSYALQLISDPDTLNKNTLFQWAEIGGWFVEDSEYYRVLAENPQMVQEEPDDSASVKRQKKQLNIFIHNELFLWKTRREQQRTVINDSFCHDYEEDLAESFSRYVYQATNFRRKMFEEYERDGCSVLLRKYIWLRNNVFNGREFECVNGGVKIENWGGYRYKLVWGAKEFIYDMRAADADMVCFFEEDKSVGLVDLGGIFDANQGNIYKGREVRHREAGGINEALTKTVRRRDFIVAQGRIDVSDECGSKRYEAGTETNLKEEKEGYYSKLIAKVVQRIGEERSDLADVLTQLNVLLTRTETNLALSPPGLMVRSLESYQYAHVGVRTRNIWLAVNLLDEIMKNCSRADEAVVLVATATSFDEAGRLLPALGTEAEEYLDEEALAIISALLAREAAQWQKADELFNEKGYLDADDYAAIAEAGREAERCFDADGELDRAIRCLNIAYLDRVSELGYSAEDIRILAADEEPDAVRADGGSRLISLADTSARAAVLFLKSKIVRLVREDRVGEIAAKIRRITEVNNQNREVVASLFEGTIVLLNEKIIAGLYRLGKIDNRTKVNLYLILNVLGNMERIIRANDLAEDPLFKNAMLFLEGLKEDINLRLNVETVPEADYLAQYNIPERLRQEYYGLDITEIEEMALVVPVAGDALGYPVEGRMLILKDAQGERRRLDVLMENGDMLVLDPQSDFILLYSEDDEQPVVLKPAKELIEDYLGTAIEIPIGVRDDVTDMADYLAGFPHFQDIPDLHRYYLALLVNHQDIFNYLSSAQFNPGVVQHYRWHRYSLAAAPIRVEPEDIYVSCDSGYDILPAEEKQLKLVQQRFAAAFNAVLTAPLANPRQELIQREMQRLFYRPGALTWPSLQFYFNGADTGCVKSTMELDEIYITTGKLNSIAELTENQFILLVVMAFFRVDNEGETVPIQSLDIDNVTDNDIKSFTEAICLGKRYIDSGPIFTDPEPAAESDPDPRLPKIDMQKIEIARAAYRDISLVDIVRFRENIATAFNNIFVAVVYGENRGKYPLAVREVLRRRKDGSGSWQIPSIRVIVGDTTLWGGSKLQQNNQFYNNTFTKFRMYKYDK